VLGFNAAEDVFYKQEFEKICETIVKVGGYVTDALPGLQYDALYTCGPEPMLKAIYNQAQALPPGHAQFSFERRMGCGFGACMVCSCKTVTGYKRICKEGPILTKEEILW
jgi:dihydroorotate dehydrogenase electron transfer subunit